MFANLVVAGTAYQITTTHPPSGEIAEAIQPGASQPAWSISLRFNAKGLAEEEQCPRERHKNQVDQRIEVDQAD